jgi:valyl-tRNA synthetase
MGVVMDVVTAVRNIRGAMRIADGVTLTATLRPGRGAEALFAATGPLIETLARVRLRIDPRASRARNSALAVVTGSEIYVELTGVIDPAAERARLQKEIAMGIERIEFRKAKLARPEFVERAPAEIVARERERLAADEALLEKLTASLGWLDDR